MAGVDASVIAKMNEPAKAAPEAVTVAMLDKKYLGWQDCNKKLAERTNYWYRGYLKSFESVAGDKAAEKINQADIDHWFAKCGEGWGENYCQDCRSRFGSASTAWLGAMEARATWAQRRSTKESVSSS
jgi:hypothetical protein